MTNDEAIKVMLKELGCIDRNDGVQCDRKCETCDLVMDAALLEDAYNLAIKALEKQTPKKPVIGYAFPEKIREVMKNNGDIEKAEQKTDCCPVCGRTLGVSKFVQTQSGMRFGDPHCKRCGQAIDWGK